MSYATFLADPLRQDIFLVEIDAYRKSDGATETLRFSSDEFATLPSETPASTVYDPSVKEGFNLTTGDAPPGTAGLLPEVKGGEIVLGQRAGHLDATLGPGGTHLVDGRRCVIKHLGYSAREVGGRLAYADAGVARDGEIAQIEVGLEDVILRLREADERFDLPLAGRRVFRGTSWCLEFDGATGTIACGSPAKLDITGDLTLEFWLFLKATTAGQQILGWSGGSADPFLVALASGSHIRFKDSATSNHFTTAYALPTDRWLHVAVTVDAAAAAVVIYDSVTDSETIETFTGSFGGRPAQSGATFYQGGNVTFLDAILDEVRVYGAEFTAALDTIRSRRMRPLTAAEKVDATLKGYWPHDDGTGSTTADLSASPANGTISGTVAWRWALEGDAQMAGKGKRDIWGAVSNCDLVLVDPERSVYLVCGTKANAVLRVYEGGGLLTLGTAYTSLTAFYATPTTVGYYDTLTYDGGTYVRDSRAPIYPLTADVEGDASGSGYVSTVADVLRRILTTRTTAPLADPGDLDTSAFTALDAAATADVGVVSEGDATLRDTIDLVLQSAGVVAFFERDSRLLAPVQFAGVTGTSQITLTSAELIALETLDTQLPVWAVEVKWGKTWRVLTDDQIAAGAITAADRARMTQEWRVARVTDDATLAEHPRAEVMTIETALTDELAAYAEAARQLAIYKHGHATYRAKAILRGLALDHLDRVTLEYEDLALSGELQARLDTGGGKDCAVLMSTEVSREGYAELVIWG